MMHHTTDGLAELLAAAEATECRYRWRARPGGGVALRYCPPTGGPVDWPAEPGDGQLDALGLAEAEAPADWEPLPAAPAAIAAADACHWSGELRRIARELAAAGYRAAWRGGRLLGAVRLQAGQPVEQVGPLALLAAADALTYGA